MSDDKLFGLSGIDTSYERELIEYRPDIHYPKKKSNYQIPLDVIVQIERSKEFTITQALKDYQLLMDRIDSLLATLKGRNQTDLFKQYLNILENQTMDEVIQFENQNTSYNQSSDYETYTILYRMRQSIEQRYNFLDQNFKNQFSDATTIEDIEQDEMNSISEWERYENALLDVLTNNSDDEDVTETDDYQMIESNRREYEKLHTSLADTSYIHKNRFSMFDNILNEFAAFIEDPKTLIKSKLKDFIMRLSTLNDISSVKAHLILTYKRLRNEHESLKNSYYFIDDSKETFASEKQYMHQQLYRKSNDSVKQFLYNYTEGENETFDLFASLMVDSLEQTEKNYKETIADLLKFYKNEAAFYHQQFTCIQNEEIIRQFYRILEDLGDIGEITSEWVDEYLKVNGYTD